MLSTLGVDAVHPYVVGGQHLHLCLCFSLGCFSGSGSTAFLPAENSGPFLSRTMLMFTAVSSATTTKTLMCVATMGLAKARPGRLMGDAVRRIYWNTLALG